MSMGTRCRHDRRFLMVTQRLCNHSAFNGYHYTRSAYSTVRCTICGSHYRTKAAFVNKLQNAPDGWQSMSEYELQKWIAGTVAKDGG
jgi:hypothetical protein